MFIIISFIVLCLLEFILIWFKWNEIQDFHKIGDVATNVIGVNEQYKGIVGWFVGKLIKMKRLVWIPITILIILNLIASFFISIGFYGIKFLIDTWIKVM